MKGRLNGTRIMVRDSGYIYGLWFGAAAVINALVYFGAADLMLRAVDVNCVKAAKRVQTWFWGMKRERDCAVTSRTRTMSSE